MIGYKASFCWFPSGRIRNVLYSLADLDLIFLRTMWGLKRNLYKENHLTVVGQKAVGYRMDGGQKNAYSSTFIIEHTFESA